MACRVKCLLVIVSVMLFNRAMVAIISAFSPSGKGQIASLSKALSASIRITKPKVATAAVNSGSDTWQKWLTGARLTRFSTGSGYSEKESYTFCPNGSFYRSFDASSSSVNAVEYRDNKTYWGGTRYFYEANKCN